MAIPGGNGTKLKISLERWNSLSIEEKTLAKRLGITPPSDVVRMEREKKECRVLELKPYILGYIETCNLCGSVHIKLYKMEPCKKGEVPYLISMEVTDEVKPDKWGARSSTFCTTCPTILRHLSKTELVDKVITMAKRGIK